MFAQLTPREAIYVLALHRLGPGIHHSEELVEELDMTSAERGSTRSQLMKQDVLFAAGRGSTEFPSPAH